MPGPNNDREVLGPSPQDLGAEVEPNRCNGIAR